MNSVVEAQTTLKPYAVLGAPVEKRLPIENVYGHTKKVNLALDVIKCMHDRSPNKSFKILDIGCGNGFAVTRFLDVCGDEILGIDFHRPNIEYANSHFGNNNLGFACLDATQLRDEGMRYDVIVLTDVLEHLHQPQNLLRLVYDLVASDGRVIVSIPNGFGPFEIEAYLHKVPIVGWVLDRSFAATAFALNRWVFRGRWNELLDRQPADLPYNSESPHVQWFTQSRFRRLVRNAGFNIERFRKLSTFSGPFSNYVFGPFARPCELNTKLADKLPASVASAWWMELSKRAERD
jgi:SAM-dependent methyltransferase